MVAHSRDGRRVVARFRNGTVLKGTTHDFEPDNTSFHLFTRGDESGAPFDVELAELKAVFFVRSYEGDPQRVDDHSFDGVAGQGRRVEVTFTDGEVLTGFTMGYAPHKPGFFVIPVDPASNNTRVFVVKEAAAEIEWVADSSPAFARSIRS